LFFPAVSTGVCRTFVSAARALFFSHSFLPSAYLTFDISTEKDLPLLHTQIFHSLHPANTQIANMRSFFVLTALALTISQEAVRAQITGNGLDGLVPQACIPICTTFSTPFTACQGIASEAAQAACVCNQSILQALAQCGACATDPAIENTVSGTLNSTPQDVQAALDSIVSGCEQEGFTLQPIEVSTVPDPVTITLSGTGISQSTSTSSSSVEVTPTVDASQSSTIITTTPTSTPTSTTPESTDNSSQTSTGGGQSSSTSTTSTSGAGQTASILITSPVVAVVTVFGSVLLLSW